MHQIDLHYTLQCINAPNWLPYRPQWINAPNWFILHASKYWWTKLIYSTHLNVLMYQIDLHYMPHWINIPNWFTLHVLIYQCTELIYTTCLPQCIDIPNWLTLQCIKSLWPGDAIWRHRYGSIFAQVMVATWRHQAITWTNVEFLLVRYCGIHLRAISQIVPKL